MNRRKFLKNISFGAIATIVPVFAFGKEQTVGNITIDWGDKEWFTFNKMQCYRTTKKFRTNLGREVMVSLWNSYAPWGKTYYLNFRSLDGMIHGSCKIPSLSNNDAFKFTPKVETVPTVNIKLTSREIKPKTIKLDKWKKLQSKNLKNES
jgi:hypothetical protein